MRFMNLPVMCYFVNVICMNDVCISCVELDHVMCVLKVIYVCVSLDTFVCYVKCYVIDNGSCNHSIPD